MFASRLSGLCRGALGRTAVRGIGSPSVAVRGFRASGALASRASSGNASDVDGWTQEGRHVIGALVVNEAGVLAGVATLLAGRGFNIDSLVVGRTEIPELSRMTIVVNGDDQALTNVRSTNRRLCSGACLHPYHRTFWSRRFTSNCRT